MSQRIALIILSTSLGLSLSGQGLSLSQATDSILGRSPLTIAADAQMRSRMATVRPTTNLANPEVGFEHLWGNEGNKMSVSVSQSFDWPGVYGKRANAAHLQATLAAAERNLTVTQARWEIEDLLIEARYELDRRTLLDSVNANYARLGAAYQRSYDLGEGTILDVKKIAIQQLGVEALMGECEQSYRTLLAQLAQYNNDIDYAALVPHISNVTTTLPERSAMQASHHPEYVLSTVSAMAADQQIKLAKSENLPGFSVGYIYNREIGETFNGVSASISLPLWGNRHKVEAARAEYEASQANTDALRTRIEGEIESEWLAARQLQARLDSYNRVLDDHNTRRLLDMALKGGEMTVMEYLQECEYFMQADLDRLAVKRDLCRSSVRLNRYID